MKPEDKIEHDGGGYYLLSDGTRTEKRGKKYAIEKQKELDEQNKFADIELNDGTVIPVDAWNDRPNYHCPVCPYATLELERLKDHVLGSHAEKEREEQQIIRTDRFGNELD